MGPGPNRCGPPSAGEPSAAVSGMDQCVTVERELEKVLHKFSGYGQLCERGLEELIDYTGGLKHEILQSHGEGGGTRGGRGPSLRLLVPRPRRLSLLTQTHPETRWSGEGCPPHTARGAGLAWSRGRRCASGKARGSAHFLGLGDFFPWWFWG